MYRESKHPPHQRIFNQQQGNYQPGERWHWDADPRRKQLPTNPNVVLDVLALLAVALVTRRLVELCHTHVAHSHEQYQWWNEMPTTTQIHHATCPAVPLHGGTLRPFASLLHTPFEQGITALDHQIG